MCYSQFRMSRVLKRDTSNLFSKHEDEDESDEEQ